MMLPLPLAVVELHCSHPCKTLYYGYLKCISYETRKRIDKTSCQLICPLYTIIYAQ
jgi:hypothetical protein